MISLLLLACGGDPVDTAAEPTLTGLEAHGLTGWDGQRFSYAEGVVPYALATPLFSDHALKFRALSLPEGETFEYGAPELPLRPKRLLDLDRQGSVVREPRQAVAKLLVPDDLLNERPDLLQRLADLLICRTHPVAQAGLDEGIPRMRRWIRSFKVEAAYRSVPGRKSAW